MSDQGWIGVDLDGTLAYYDKWRGISHIGAPIPMMLRRVKQWLYDGKEVRIFTARVSAGDQNALEAIQQWLKEVGLPPLVITCMKDFNMTELWDDRAVQVEMNTGRRMDGQYEI